MGQVCATEDSITTRPQADLDSPSSATEAERASRSPPLLRDIPELDTGRETEHPTAVPFTPVKELHVASIVLLPDDANEVDVEEFEGPITPARPAPPQLIEGWLKDTVGFWDRIDVKGDRELLGSASADIMEPSENDFIYRMRGPTTPTRLNGPPTLLNFFAAALR